MFKKLFKFVQTLNLFLVEPLSQGKLLEKLCKSFVDILGVEVVLIGSLDPSFKNLQILTTYKHSSLAPLTDLPNLYNYLLNSEKSLIQSSAQENKIKFKSLDCINSFLKRKYVTVIPIFESQNLSFLIFLISSNLIFEEGHLYLLEEVKKTIEDALEINKHISRQLLFLKALENSNSWVMILDNQGIVTYINDVVCKLSGYSKEEILGKRPIFIFPELKHKKTFENFHKTLSEGREFKKIFLSRKKDGTLFHLELSIYPVKINNEVIGFISIGKDLTQEILTSFELEKLKFYDPLTELINFKGFFFRAQRRLEPNSIASLILLDLWDFSYVNRVYGISNGDRILRLIAERLKEIIEETDIIGRLAGDTFGIFVSYLQNQYEVFKVLQKIEEIFKMPFTLENTSITLNFNCGISLYPLDAMEFEELYEKASLALSYSKKQGPNKITFFSQSIEEEKKYYFKITHLIENAFKSGFFVFFYQPFFRTQDLSMVGVESLIRMILPEGTIYYPKDFIEILENSIYFIDFKVWAIEELTQKSFDWKIPISLNLNPKSFKIEQILQKIKEAICKCGANLWIEITEKALIEDFTNVINFVNTIKECRSDVRLILDDFGTGFSSLTYLRELPIDIVKIDKIFIQNMIPNLRDRILVKTIIQLCKEFEILSLGEGVETEEQFEILREFGCDLVQGFLFSKPLPEDRLITILEAQPQR